MSTIKDELNNIAALACIKVDDAHRTHLADDLQSMIAFVEALCLVDTKGTTPLMHPLDLHQRLRKDELTEANQVTQLAKIAPQFADDLYLVPKVIER